MSDDRSRAISMRTIEIGLERAAQRDREDRILAEVRERVRDTRSEEMFRSINAARVWLHRAEDTLTYLQMNSKDALLNAAACVIRAIEAEDRRREGK